MQKCSALLLESIASESQGGSPAPAGIDAIVLHIQRIDWRAFVRPPQGEDRPAAPGATAAPARPDDLRPLLSSLLRSTMGVHDLIADSFLNHQARIAATSQPMLRGF